MTWLSLTLSVGFIFGILGETFQRAWGQEPRDLAAAQSCHEFRRAVESGDLFKVRGAWNKVNKNNQGLTNVSQCFKNVVGTALLESRFTLADKLMSSEFGFPLNEIDKEAPRDRQSALQIAANNCDAAQVLVLRIYGVSDQEAKNEQGQVEEQIIYNSPADGKKHVGRDGYEIGHKGTHMSFMGWPKVKTPEQKKKRAEADVKGAEKNRLRAQECRSTLWALTTDIARLEGKKDLTPKEHGANDFTRDGLILKYTVAHREMTENGMDTSDDENPRCSQTPLFYRCHSPIHRVIQAMRHVLLHEKKLPDEDQREVPSDISVGSSQK